MMSLKAVRTRSRSRSGYSTANWTGYGASPGRCSVDSMSRTSFATRCRKRDSPPERNFNRRLTRPRLRSPYGRDGTHRGGGDLVAGPASLQGATGEGHDPPGCHSLRAGGEDAEPESRLPAARL